MPVVSKKQGKFMQAVANSPEFANKVGVNQSVGQEFTKEKDMKKVKKMNMGGRAMNDRDGSVAMDPKMQMAMAAQQRQAAAGGMATGGMLARTGGSSAPMKAKGKAMAAGGNTSRQNRTEELGRVDAERADTASGRRNLSDEKSRIRGELGMKHGGSIKDKAGRAMKRYKGAKQADAEGRALGGTKKSAGKKSKSSASKRADGIAQRGHTRGRMV